MSDSREEKREMFIDSEKRGMKIKPGYIAGLIVVVAIIAIAAAFVIVESDEAETIGNSELIPVQPVFSDPEMVDNQIEEVNSAESVTAQAPVPVTQVANFSIKGMTCGGCSNGIMNGLGEAEGVIGCNVSWRDKSGIVEYDPSVTSPQVIADFITGMGFTAAVDE